ncbi:hypothetical protein J4457_05520 [Candidatus Woesearchaeota archaeon]|nr:hypothetical protein [Candidatus Woesearchaeota archaeon]
MANEEVEDEYELIPHKEIVELKDEIQKLHENPPSPSKHLQISMNDLAKRLEEMTTIFEKAMQSMTEEEGGITFQEKMQPVLHRMDKILEQNAQIADGIVAMADIVNELKDKVDRVPSGSSSFEESFQPPGAIPPPPSNFPPPPGMPPLAGFSPNPPLMGMPPPPPRRR